jgi:hypothetical protein
MIPPEPKLGCSFEISPFLRKAQSRLTLAYRCSIHFAICNYRFAIVPTIIAFVSTFCLLAQRPAEFLLDAGDFGLEAIRLAFAKVEFHRAFDPAAIGG